MTTVLTNRHPLDTLTSPNISELDGTNSVNMVAPAEILEKPMR